MYYNYHAIVKRKLTNYQLIKYELKDKYHHLKDCLVLYFDDGSIYPIREERIAEYLLLIDKLYKNRFT